MVDIRSIEHKIDNVEAGAEAIVSTVKGSKYSDIGRGLVVPTKDVIRGVKRLHEAREGLFARISQFMSIASFALLIIILIKGGINF